MTTRPRRKLVTLKPRLRELGPAVAARGWAETRQGSRHERGYGTAWDKLRDQIMVRDCGLCQPCKLAGRLTQAHAVDHIVNKERWKQEHDGSLDGCDDPSNLQAICKPCHATKTAAESREPGSPVLGPVRRSRPA